ncbi:hypothetical protein HPB47_020083 [Ixodes persulcatus]|uniref:Uncharacterized protein n=1 Tax=Ixodes persulcatus TaxID=34615 RepID=A0AC60QGJ1_IXOPE|nr:hypothetical protein HPB47_020083 [Ixodes persulcatus]
MELVCEEGLGSLWTSPSGQDTLSEGGTAHKATDALFCLGEQEVAPPLASSHGQPPPSSRGDAATGSASNSLKRARAYTYFSQSKELEDRNSSSPDSPGDKSGGVLCKGPVETRLSPESPEAGSPAGEPKGGKASSRTEPVVAIGPEFCSPAHFSGFQVITQAASGRPASLIDPSSDIRLDAFRPGFAADKFPRQLQTRDDREPKAPHIGSRRPLPPEEK